MNRRLVRGDLLTVVQQRSVLARYIYRLTTENGYPERNPCKARVPAITDAQWMREHAFYVTAKGELDHRYNFCEPGYMADEVQP